MSAPVTIAIPCYNAGSMIAAAVESALRQDWPNFEIIVVDDGSSDDSRERVRCFGDQVRLIEAAHRGGNAARNLALREAKGDWVQFLDADDLLLPAKISQQLAGAEDEDVIFSPVLFEQHRQRTASAIDPRRSIAALWLAWELPQTGGCLWRREPLLRIGGWNEATPCCQEYELYSRAIQAGLRFRFAPDAGAVYRVWSEETLCRKDTPKLIEVRTGLYRDFLDWRKKVGGLSEDEARLAGRACFEMARTLAKTDPAAAARYHAGRRREGLIHLAGPAAPASYRVAYSLLGFSAAENLARAFRRKS